MGGEIPHINGCSDVDLYGFISYGHIHRFKQGAVKMCVQIRFQFNIVVSAVQQSIDEPIIEAYKKDCATRRDAYRVESLAGFSS